MQVNIISHQITRHLKRTIREEKDGETPVVLRPRHLQGLRQALYLRIADIASIEKTQQIQQGQHGEQTQVHLPQDFFLIDMGEIDTAPIPVWIVVCKCVIEGWIRRLVGRQRRSSRVVIVYCGVFLLVRDGGVTAGAVVSHLESLFHFDSDGREVIGNRVKR